MLLFSILSSVCFTFVFEHILTRDYPFKGGVEGKRQVDKVIDKCASMQV